jgi:hypothetical protein
MELPTPTQAVAAFATFVRARLVEVGGTLAPLIARADRTDGAARVGEHDPRHSVRSLATVIITAAAPFAPTSHARARLLRQAHASGLLRQAQSRGLLTDDEADQAVAVITAAG